MAGLLDRPDHGHPSSHLPTLASLGAAVLAGALLIGCGGSEPLGPPPAIEQTADPEATATRASQRPQVVPDQFIIRFRPGADIPPGLAQTLAGQYGLDVRHEFSNLFQGFSAVVPQQALQGLQNHPAIESIEPVGLLYLDAPAAAAVVTAPNNGLRLRLVANQLSLADGATVDSWPNLGGTEAMAVQGIKNRRPTFHAAGATGKFGGAAHVGFNETDSDELLEVSGVAPHGSATLVAVFSQDDEAAHNYGLMAIYGNSNNRGTFATSFSNAGDALGYWDFSVGQHNSTFSPSAGVEHVAVWRIDGSNAVDFQVDGVSHGSFPITSDMHPTFDRYLLGAPAPRTSHSFSGQVAELLLYDRPLSDCERDQLVADLGAEYGISTNGAGSLPCDPPISPSGLSASTVDHLTIDLSWTDNSSDEDGFTVERRLGQNGTFSEIAQTGAGVGTHTDTGLAAETEYCYRVAAFNVDGTSAYSSVQCATTAAAPPPPPAISVPGQGLRLRLVANQLSLVDGATVDSWANVGGSEAAANQTDAARRPTFHAAGATGKFGGRAHVGFNEAGTGQFLDVAGVTPHGSATLVAVFNQDNNASHNYGLLAIYENSGNRGTFATSFLGGGDPLGYWDWSIGQHNSTFSVTAGVEHVAVWRIDGSNVLDFQVDGVSYGSFPISSDMHPVFSRYLVGAPEPSGANPFEGQLAELLLYDRPLSNCERDQLVGDLGAEYGISVNGAGAGGCTVPTAPSDLTAIALDHQSIQLSWVDLSADEDGFTIERREGATGSFSVVAQTGPGETNLTDSGLAADTEYCYRVAAFNGNGTSNFTAVECDTTGPAPPLPPAIDVPGQGLRLRLVASELGLADGSPVDTWPNFGGSEAAAAQSDGARQPFYHAAGTTNLFGGQAHVGFNEGVTGQFLDVTGVSSHGSATLVSVFSQDSKASHNYALLALYQNTGDRGTFATTFWGNGDPLGYWDFSIGQHNSSFSPSVGQAHVAVWRIDGSNLLDFQVDGVSQGSVSITSDIHAIFSRYLIGSAQPTGSNPFEGQVAELLLYDRALTNCERNQLVGDLGTQYNVDVNGIGPGSCNPPAPPSGLDATAVDHQSIQLMWVDGSANEDGFTIERRQGQSGSFTAVAQTGSDVADYLDLGLASATEYCYRVAAFNADDTSAFSSVQCATTGAPQPPPPVVPAPGAGLRLRLVASQLGLAEGSPVGSWPNLGGTEGPAEQIESSRQPSFHAPGVSGKFGGRAHVGFNEGSAGEYLDVSGVTAHGSATLVAVFSHDTDASHNYGLLAIYENSGNRGTFATAFSNAGDALGYWDWSIGQHNSSFSPAAGGEHVAVWRIEGSSSLDFQVDGVSQGSSSITKDMHPVFSRYLVGAPEPGNNNPFEGQIAELLLYDRPLFDCERDDLVRDLGAEYGIDVNGVGSTPCDPPAAPSGLTAAAPDYQAIGLSWVDASTNEDGFTVERRLGQSGAFEVLAQLSANEVSYQDSTVIPLNEYCYRVTAFNGDGQSATNIACATPPAPPPGVCFDTGNHDDLGPLWGMQRIAAAENRHWSATQVPGCEISTWIFILDSGIDSDHPDLNVADAENFVAAEPSHTGEDGHGHGTHVAGTAAAIDGNGGVVGVAPGAPVFGYRVCGDAGSCQVDDIIAAMDSVFALKQANPGQPMVVNMSLAGSSAPPLDQALRTSTNSGIVYVAGAGNGLIGACFLPADAQTVSPAGVGDDAINAQGGSDGNTARLNGVLTVTLSTEQDHDGDCNYGNPVTIAAPGSNILSTWLDGGYNTISGTSMASPHGAGAAALYLHEFPSATPVQVEQWIMGQLDPWTTDDLPNADGRLNIRRP